MHVNCIKTVIYWLSCVFPARRVPLRLTKDAWIKQSTRGATASLEISTEIRYISFLTTKKKKIFTCFLLDSVSTLFFLLLIAGEFVFMWLTRATQQIGEQSRAALPVKREPFLEQPGLFQCWGLPGGLAHTRLSWPAIRLQLQPSASEFCQTLQYWVAAPYQCALFTLLSFPVVPPTFSPPFLTIHLLMLFNSYLFALCVSDLQIWIKLGLRLPLAYSRHWCNSVGADQTWSGDCPLFLHWHAWSSSLQHPTACASHLCTNRA